ncbi:MAG: alanine racemase [Bacteroidetes bacterium]|nr:alanine racemase [Bacteroidota bacterium]MBU1678014.1 alanine racemase [Bacteroidota bacterium]MBU2508226.1 alanine racemase [Bacteroidota bacterium]
MRSTFAEINLSSLIHNYINIRKKVKNRKVMAVVKADAYGHGAVEAVKTYESLGSSSPEWYGVALTEEGIELRKAKVTKKPILTFSPFQYDELDEYRRYNITPSLSAFEQLEQIKLKKLKNVLKVHVNIDSGMGRMGVRFDEAVKFFSALTAIKNIEVIGIYTHFATSDERDKRFAKLQLQRFNSVLALLKEAAFSYGIVHAANSGAILDLEDAYFDMVRPGISLYGYYPSLQTKGTIKLKPVMSLISKVSEIREIKKGESVSYGRKFIAKENITTAAVPIGYADGVNRNLTNKIHGIIRNKKFEQIGRVTMDRIIFNVTNSKVQVGDKIILFGENKLSIDAWTWSSILKTIPYEITCNISKRVPRIFIK